MLVNLKKIIPIFIFLIIFVFIFCFCQFLLTISVDEIWEYGYGYNIANGLIPYRDFNMVVTPLYSYISSIFIKVLGPYLLSINILNALILTFTFFIWYKLLGKKAIVLFSFMLFFPAPTYNNLVLFLFFLFLYIKEKNIDERKKIIYSSLILSAIFLTKQSIGVVLFLIEFLMTKSKKVFIIYFSIPIILLVIYLFFNKALYAFIDYSFLGLFDFGTRNGNISFYMYISLIVSALLLLLYGKYRQKNMLYALGYQIMAFPIFDFYHTHMGIIAFIFVLLLTYSKRIPNVVTYFAFIFFLICSFHMNRGDDYIVKEKNYMYGRCANDAYFEIINGTSNIIDKYVNSYDQIYNLTRYSYLVKLYRGDKINKFDMTLNGNMGYKGYKKYIRDIDENCENNKCLIIISSKVENNYMQKNYEILDYVVNNYNLIDNSYLGYEIYSN